MTDRADLRAWQKEFQAKPAVPPAPACISAALNNAPITISPPAPTLAEAAKVLLDAWDADDLRVVGPWADAHINGLQFGNLLRRIAEGGE